MAVVLGGSACPSALAATSYDRLATVTPQAGGFASGASAQSNGDSITGAVPLGDIALGGGASLDGVTLSFVGNEVRISAGARLACPAGGDVEGRLTGRLAYTATNTWSVAADMAAGARGCSLVSGLPVDPGSGVHVTLRSDRGRLTLVLDASASITTSLIPTQSAFSLDAHLEAGRDGFSASLRGAAPGATFSGAVADDGTYSLAFSLALAFGTTQVQASGSVKRATPGGSVTTEVHGELAGDVQLARGLHLLAASLHWDGTTLGVAGTLRVVCQEGTLEVGVSGSVSSTRRAALRVDGRASGCTLGNGLVVLDGAIVQGALSWADGATSIDLAVGGIDLDTGTFRLSRNENLRVRLTDLAVQLTNTCESCGGETIRVTLHARPLVSLEGAYLGGSPLDLGLTVDLRFDLGWPDGTPKAAVVSVRDTTTNGSASGFAFTLEAYFRRWLEGVFLPQTAMENEVTRSCADAACVTGVSAASSKAASTSKRGATRIRALRVRVTGGRARVTLQATRQASISLDIQRRHCVAGLCRWRLVSYRLVRTDARGRAQITLPTRLARARYRVLVRVGARGNTKASTRTFDVR
ncbi:MAG: hypothetical protein JHC95_01505 [Solirubrobacteraceae bacterium]|nr:hypothetical protein [Solirubrobacteraceae bacterium]